MAGNSPTPPRSRPRQSPALSLVVALTTMVMGLGLWLGGSVAPAVAAGPCELGDFVWHDRNGNALQDDFEEGVPGVTVSLLDVDEQPVDVDPVITDADGAYLFDDLACGTYVVKFDTNSRDGGSLTGTKAGDDPTRDSDPARRGFDTHIGWTDPVVLTEDDPSDLTIDAGILIDYEECSIGDFVWSDENENGIQDEGEPGIPGVEVQLADETGEPVGYDPVLTDAQGRYAFPEILCGGFILKFRVPTGAAVTESAQGDDRAKDSNISARPWDPTWAEAGVKVGIDDFDPAHRSDQTVDAGFILDPEPPEFTCAVGDRAWLDRDADGLQDPKELPAAGIVVILYDDEGQVMAPPTTTDENGWYGFDNLLCLDNYVIAFGGYPEENSISPRQVGEDRTTDSDPGPNGRTAVFGLGDDEPNSRPSTDDDPFDADFVNTTIDVGIVPPAVACAIGDRVWNDLDGDGLQSEGEPGVPGVTVTLLERDFTPVIEVAPVQTDAEGRYRFDELSCHEYAVKFSGLPDGAEFTGRDRGDDDGLDSDAGAGGVTPLVPAGNGHPSENLSLDAGLRLPAGSPSPEPSESSSPEPSESSSPEPSASPGEEPSASSSDGPSDSARGELPATGADDQLGWLLGGAATMITAGGLLIARRRRLG